VPSEEEEEEASHENSQPLVEHEGSLHVNESLRLAPV